MRNNLSLEFGEAYIRDLTVYQRKLHDFNYDAIMFQGLYDLHIQMMGIPLLPWEPPELSYGITAR